MNLPSLDELGLNEPQDKSSEKVKKTKVEKSNLIEEKKKNSIEKEEKKEESLYKENGKRKIPKSQYDENGSPILSIPDLDDVNLRKELDKFF